MGTLPEPDNVDFIVDGADEDPALLRETQEFIQSSRARPDYAVEVAELKAKLTALGIDTANFVISDPYKLWDHWKRCVAELLLDPKREGNGRSTTESANAVPTTGE